ncbi:MAG: GTP-binding protein, partial [Planctomycetota bacterium]
MAQVNFAKGEVQCKVVFYGPAQSGKTANLRTIHARSPEHVRGKLTSIATDGERTLFFDYLPLNLGKVASIRTKINIYAVPYIEGQNALRLLVLEGVDGIVFVADSSRARVDENREALENLRTNLAAVGRDLSEVPLVFQWNKSDCADAMTSEEMTQALDASRWERLAAAALQGTGVLATLKTVTRHVLEHVSGMMDLRSAPAEEKEEDEAEPSISAPDPEPEEVEPVFRPAWHDKAPDTSTHSNLLPDLPQTVPSHQPVAGIQRGTQPAMPHGDLDKAKEEPLELERPAARAEPEVGAHSPPDFILEKAADLKNWSREADSAPGWEDSERSDPLMSADSAETAFPAFGGGMAPVSEDDDNQFVTVGGGSPRGSIRTVRQQTDTWDPENSPQPL